MCFFVLEGPGNMNKTIMFCNYSGTFYYRPQSEGDNVLGRVCLSIRPSPLSRLNRLTYNLDICYVGWPWPWLGWDCRSRVKFNAKNCVLTSWYLALRSRSKVGVKVKGPVKVKDQRSSSRSRSNFWHAAVDISGLPLPNAAKSKEEWLSVQGVCLCVK